jgi:hypothetical protein
MNRSLVLVPQSIPSILTFLTQFDLLRYFLDDSHAVAIGKKQSVFGEPHLSMQKQLLSRELKQLV